MISSSSETKQNPDFSFHSPRLTSGQVSFLSRHNPPRREAIWGEGKTGRWLEGVPERAATLTEVQENLLLLPLHEQLVVGQEVCVLLLLDLLDDGFCLLEQGHGHRETPLFTDTIRRHVTACCPGSQIPDAAPDPGPHLGLPSWCFLAQPFSRENPALVK